MKSITRRWLFNCLSIIVVVLIVLDLSFVFAMRSYYYDNTRQQLDSKANLVSSLFTRLMDDSNIDLSDEIRSVVESFSDRDRMEMMALDHSGEAVITSSGFSYSDTLGMTDYAEAVTARNGRGTYVGKMASGEKVMAVTVLLPVINREFSALRFVVSLEQVDRQALIAALVFTAICVLILVFVLISGLYFIKSIVLPVREVGAASRKIAAGDLEVRVERKNNDELGELCDTINSMADELQTSNRVKNEFISSVSHELRTPLTAIKGWGETLLATSPEDEETREKGMHVILSETDRLSAMVEELLDFSRMESGRMTMIKTKIDILAELEEAVLMYQARAKGEDKIFLYDEPEMLPFVFGDKGRLRQVFVNIIDNALKYSDPGDTIRVSAAQADGRVEIAVSDTGVGIPKEEIPNVTQKFYKANTTRRGSGIGLAVADEIIRLHDGSLTIESELGEGTTVRISLPIWDRD